MLWSKILLDWLNGKIFKYPIKLTKRFMWNTSVLKNNGNVEFLQTFQINSSLPSEQDTTIFQKYFEKSNNKYSVAFYNLSKDAILAVPMPINNNNYATLKDFIDNAPIIQQQKFWKKVAKKSY